MLMSVGIAALGTFDFSVLSGLVPEKAFARVARALPPSSPENDQRPDRRGVTAHAVIISITQPTDFENSRGALRTGLDARARVFSSDDTRNRGML